MGRRRTYADGGSGTYLVPWFQWSKTGACRNGLLASGKHPLPPRKQQAALPRRHGRIEVSGPQRPRLRGKKGEQRADFGPFGREPF